MYISNSKKNAIRDAFARGIDSSEICTEFHITIDTFSRIVASRDSRLCRVVDLFTMYKSIARLFTNDTAIKLCKYFYYNKIWSLDTLRRQFNSKKYHLKFEDEISYLLSIPKEYYVDNVNVYTSKFIKFFAKNNAYDCLDFLINNGYTSLKLVSRDIGDMLVNSAKYVCWSQDVVNKIALLIRKDVTPVENISMLKELFSLILFNAELDTHNVSAVNQVYDIIVTDAISARKHATTLQGARQIIADYINSNIPRILHDEECRKSMLFVLTLLYGKDIATDICAMSYSQLSMIKACATDGEVKLMYKNSIPIQKIISTK